MNCASDLTEREFWDDYQHAYQEAIAATAAPEAPWFIVPADNKWFTRVHCRGGNDRGAGGLTHPGPTEPKKPRWRRRDGSWRAKHSANASRLTGCHIGLRAGRSAEGVGHAATEAVVTGIVGVIALDAIFAVCSDALGI